MSQDQQKGRRRTLWSPWVLVTWPLALLGALLGIVELYVFLDEGRDPVALALATLIGLPCVVLLVRLPVRRVTITQDELAYHGVWKTTRIPWDRVRSIALEESGADIVGTSYVPRVVLLDGHEERPTCLAGYTLFTRPRDSRAGRQVGVLREYVAGPLT